MGRDRSTSRALLLLLLLFLLACGERAEHGKPAASASPAVMQGMPSAPGSGAPAPAPMTGSAVPAGAPAMTGGSGGVAGANTSPGAAGTAASDAGTAGSGAAPAGTGGDEPAPDAGLASADAGEQAAAGTSAPVPEAPVFQSTRCIDPNDVVPDTETDFPCDGVDLWVALPKACVDHRCGLIFNIHGGGMNDHATMDQATHMIALGNAADFVVVHPHKGTWNVAADKDAVFGFMQQVITAFDVDPKRVHSTGYSQGGQISWALACEHADVVASVAPAEEINRVTDCWQNGVLPARELPILFAYGKRDSIGGGYAAASQLAADVASAWHMMGPETIAGAAGTPYLRQRWTSAAGNVLEMISHDYTSTGVGGILAGHCLPMASGTTFVSCSTPVDYDWGQEVVRFFQAHPLP
jgi:pimeloyl-ACP methyl ester carboxylesterase